MPSLKDLRKRIGSVKNTQQTTKAMKMVSAAKLRRAQESIVGNRPYALNVGRLIQLVSTMADQTVTSPLVNPEGHGKPQNERKVLLVVVTSDRGLCGAFNGSVIKKTEAWIKANKDAYADIRLAFVGRKGNDALKNRYPDRIESYSEFGPKATFKTAKDLTDKLIAKFESGEIDEVKFVYNEFKNAITQILQVEDFLPVRESPFGHAGKAEDVDLYMTRPDAGELLKRLINRHFAIQAFRVLLESQASEHGARMASMDNATKNAGEMIASLTLEYNKSRQASITKELLEITSGAEALKG
ncbi:MAG TPA: ATP synthase F1 subunit gamma [Bdellovibrionota bacterium]|jgi:F-type H+-transporting ATPase subunit gamma|nr:ATP synthase F1 subunit gamma [Bdellovibrionota bacterium]